MEVVLVSNQKVSFQSPIRKTVGNKQMWAASTNVLAQLNLADASQHSQPLRNKLQHNEFLRHLKQQMGKFTKERLVMEFAFEDQTHSSRDYNSQRFMGAREDFGLYESGFDDLTRILSATDGITYNCVLTVSDDIHGDGLLEMLNDHCNGGLQLKVNMTFNPSWLLKNHGVRNYNRRSYNSGNQLSSVVAEGEVKWLPTLEAFGMETEVTMNAGTGTSSPYGYTNSSNVATVTIIAVLPDENTKQKDASVSDKLSINKKILKDEIASDVTIVSNNGAHIKCHKNFLSAHSTVLATMFQTSMRESKTSRVEMPDMTEASVRAFLAYLYHWEVEQPTNNSLVCFELLNAGHKYDIQNLEDAMQSILLSKDNNWYDVDVAMRLFLFSRNLPEGDRLKMKAIQVLKSKFSTLEQSASYQELFKKDPRAAMELCKYAFSV